MNDNSPFALWRWVDTFSHIDIFIQGFGYTLLVAVLALSISLFMGIFHALMATGKFTLLRWWARAYVEFFQNTPLLINLFFLYYVLPKVPYIGITLDVFTIGVVGIGVYTGAYMSEVVRSGIQSIPKGQFEAAASQGFSYAQTMMYIILPQTIKVILPPATNQAVNLIKNTSVLAIIAGAEIMYNADSYAQSSLNYAPAYVIAGIFYFVVCYCLALFTRFYEEKLKKAHLAR
ncbi:amino acid ABC transporter permease [Helicobacter didelphidarum]|uniref:Amino acid ABC transporter permease n=1 Tax=Helicobacter didelphidarum TaxID=2040648 RepID=A0A3D8IM39_9HELI|nr:amino acid ABC transporter permease [Helicobacter didelphidarum]RDU66080.1 amino acid ABC transporter permease [Helicobacter didelphidarum]